MEAALQDVKHELRQLTSKQKQARQAAKNHQAKQRRMLQDAFALYVLTDCGLDAPLALMDELHSVPHEEVRAHLERLYLDTPVEELAQYCCVSGRIVPKVKARTEKFFKEWNLKRWVNKINDDIGTTPSFSNIADCLEVGASSHDTTESHGDPKAGGAKKWIQRWRRKWKGSISRVKTQLGGDVTKLSAKVFRKKFWPGD